MNKTEKQLSDLLDKYLIEEFGKEYIRAQKAASNASWNIHFGPECTHWADKQYKAQLNRVKAFIEEHIKDFWLVKAGNTEH